ncbi:alpha/beta hydrolase [Conyzicola lurida]
MLSEDGYDVVEFANPLRSLDGDADYLAGFIDARTEGPVLLVGHSYGGALLGAAALRTPRVRGLVYVNAFVPASGESLLDLLGSAGPVDPGQLFDMVPYPDAPAGDVDLYIKRGAFEPAFATGLSPELQTEFYAKQRPITLAAVGAPAAAGQAWESLPSWYVAGTLDGSIPLALQLRMATRAGSTLAEIEAGHLSMVSNPREVANVIREAALSLGMSAVSEAA